VASPELAYGQPSQEAPKNCLILFMYFLSGILIEKCSF